MQQQTRLRLFVAASFLAALSILSSSFSEMPAPHPLVTIVSDAPRDVSTSFTNTLTNLSFVDSKKGVYDSLGLESRGLSHRVFLMALKGMEKLIRAGQVTTDVLSIIDFSQSSNSKRLYVIDLDNFRLLFNTLVAHGRNSGTEWANSFSNRNRSKKSSLGFYVTGETYNGTNGYSLKLQGAEAGFNSNALRRAIVVHGADYVSDRFIQSQGFIGRSLGCPAVPAEISSELIDSIKNGSCMFIYHPSLVYRKRSALLK